MQHYAVLCEEAIGFLAVRPEGIYVDVTAGLGGHTVEIARRLITGKLIARDRDAESLARARENAAPWADRIVFEKGLFSDLTQSLQRLGIARVDGILADLGVSFYQLTDPARGFSVMADGPLDMRMDRSQESTAADLVNYSAEKDLAELIFTLAGEGRSRRVARAIVRARPFSTTSSLAQAIERAVPRTGRLHPATKTFMALRMAVNREPEELDALLKTAPALVKPGGRIVIISFMSTDDRKIKQSFQSLARAGRAEILTRRIVTPGEEEIRRNPPSRSARLRALEMTSR